MSQTLNGYAVLFEHDTKMKTIQLTDPQLGQLRVWYCIEFICLLTDYLASALERYIVQQVSTYKRFDFRDYFCPTSINIISALQSKPRRRVYPINPPKPHWNHLLERRPWHSSSINYYQGKSSVILTLHLSLTMHARFPTRLPRKHQ